MFDKFFLSQGSWRSSAAATDNKSSGNHFQFILAEN